MGMTAEPAESRGVGGESPSPHHLHRPVRPPHVFAVGSENWRRSTRVGDGELLRQIVRRGKTVNQEGGWANATAPGSAPVVSAAGQGFHMAVVVTGKLRNVLPHDPYVGVRGRGHDAMLPFVIREGRVAVLCGTSRE